MFSAIAIKALVVATEANKHSLHIMKSCFEYAVAKMKF